MASQALVRATNTALKPFQPTAFQEHSSALQQQQPSAPQKQQQSQAEATAKDKRQQSSPGGGLKKGLDNLTKCIERKIDQQIRSAQERGHDTSSPPAAVTNGVNKKVHWEVQSHDAQVAA